MFVLCTFSCSKTCYSFACLPKCFYCILSLRFLHNVYIFPCFLQSVFFHTFVYAMVLINCSFGAKFFKLVPFLSFVMLLLP